MEKQREKAAEIAAALFEEATRQSSPTSESSSMTLQQELKNKWRSAEDIHSAKFKKTRINDLKAKENLWRFKQNLEKAPVKCNNVQKGKWIVYILREDFFF